MYLYIYGYMYIHSDHACIYHDIHTFTYVHMVIIWGLGCVEGVVAMAHMDHASNAL